MPASTKYRSRELRAQRDGLSIYGQLYLPGDYAGGALPCVVCAHGFGANYLHNVPYAWYLAERGYAVCCFDFCGGGYASKSDGNPLDMSLASELADYEAILDELVTQPEVDADNVYLMGEGQGGFVATMAAHARPEVARGLILLYPAFQLHDEARRTFPTKKNIPVSYRLFGMRVGRGYGLAMWDTNPYTQMRDYEGNVLIIHGDEDATSLIEYSERAADVFPSARLETIHGARHVFRDRYLARASQLMYEFVRAEVAGEPFVPSSEDEMDEEPADTPAPRRAAHFAAPAAVVTAPAASGTGKAAGGTAASRPATSKAAGGNATTGKSPTGKPPTGNATAGKSPVIRVEGDADSVIAALSAAGKADAAEEERSAAKPRKPAHAAEPSKQPEKPKLPEYLTRSTHTNTQRSRYNPNYVAKLASARHYRRQG